MFCLFSCSESSLTLSTTQLSGTTVDGQLYAEVFSDADSYQDIPSFDDMYLTVPAGSSIDDCVGESTDPRRLIKTLFIYFM